jgi:hypothetical protein
VRSALTVDEVIGGIKEKFCLVDVREEGREGGIEANAMVSADIDRLVGTACEECVGSSGGEGAEAVPLERQPDTVLVASTKKLNANEDPTPVDSEGSWKRRRNARAHQETGHSDPSEH